MQHNLLQSWSAQSHTESQVKEHQNLIQTNIDRGYRHAKYPSVQWICKKNQPAYANHMFLGQARFPSWAQRNSIAHSVPFSPGTTGMAKQKAQSCLKFFYASITCNTFYLVYLECSRRNLMFWQWPNFIMPRFFSVPVGGFPSRNLIKGPPGGSPANILCSLSYCRVETQQNKSRWFWGLFKNRQSHHFWQVHK